MRTRPAPHRALRRATFGDIPALLDIENAAFPGNRLDRRRFRHLLGSARAVMLVDAAGAGLRGYVLLLLRAGSPIARIYSIATHPACRGQGVASRLVDGAERLAREHGRTRLRLEIRVDNAASLALFAKHGYRVFGRHPDYYHDGMDALRLEKTPGGLPAPSRGRGPQPISTRSCGANS